MPMRKRTLLLSVFAFSFEEGHSCLKSSIVLYLAKWSVVAFCRKNCFSPTWQRCFLTRLVALTTVYVLCSVSLEFSFAEPTSRTWSWTEGAADVVCTQHSNSASFRWAVNLKRWQGDSAGRRVPWVGYLGQKSKNDLFKNTRRNVLAFPQNNGRLGTAQEVWFRQVERLYQWIRHISLYSNKTGTYFYQRTLAKT